MVSEPRRGLAEAWRRVGAAWQQPESRWLGAILVLAAALRIAWVLYASREPQGLHDPALYYGYGKVIADGFGYALPDGPTAYYPVGYPGTLGALYFLVGHTPIPDNLVLATGFFQAFLGLATVALVYYVGRRLFTTAVGLLAALWMALFPNLIFHTAAFLTETLFLFLLLSAVAVLLSARWEPGRPDWPRLLGFAALLGLSALVRPISLLLLGVLPVAWLIAGYGWRRALGYSGAVLVVTAAVIAPWTIRNAVRMEAFVIISTNLGDNLCIGHHPNATGEFALPEYCFPEEKYAGLSRPEFEVRRNSDNIRSAWEFVREFPVDELELLSRRAVLLWKHDHDGLRAVESYGADPFISPDLSLVILPDKVPDNQFYFILQGVERLTDLTEADLAEQVLAAREDGVEELVVLEELDTETAYLIRQEVLFGVRVKDNSSLRAVLEGIADGYFFVTISLGGLGLAGFVLAASPSGALRPAGRSAASARRVFVLLTLLAMAGVPLIFFGDARFHVPALPFLSIAAAWFVVTAFGAIPGLRRSRLVEVADAELAPSEQDALEDAETNEEREQGAAPLTDER